MPQTNWKIIDCEEDSQSPISNSKFTPIGWKRRSRGAFPFDVEKCIHQHERHASADWWLWIHNSEEVLQNVPRLRPALKLECTRNMGNTIRSRQIKPEQEPLPPTTRQIKELFQPTVSGHLLLWSLTLGAWNRKYSIPTGNSTAGVQPPDKGENETSHPTRNKQEPGALDQALLARSARQETWFA